MLASQRMTSRRWNSISQWCIMDRIHVQYEICLLESLQDESAWLLRQFSESVLCWFPASAQRHRQHTIVSANCEEDVAGRRKGSGRGFN